VTTLPGRLRRGWAALRSLRVRLTLWYVALLAAILVGFSVFLYASLARNLGAELDRSLVELQPRVADSVDIRGRGIDVGDLADELGADALVAVYSLTGEQVLAGGSSRSRAGLGSALAALPRDQSALQALSAAGERWRVLTFPAVERGVVVGAIQIARSERGLEAALRQLFLLIALAIPLTLLVAVAGGLFLAGRALDPIDRITRAAARISAEDLSRRLGFRGGDDEVGRLAATFDGMLDRLEGAFQRQRRFTADASHELRTPLAILASQLEVALDRPRAANEYRQVLQSVADDVGGMTQLVAELLMLARADAGQEVVARERLDLAELAAQVLSAMEQLARSRGVRLRGEVGRSVAVAGDQTRLTQLLLNLVDNALKYTPAGGEVTVAVTSEPGAAVVRVTDTGIGIAPADLPHVVERFYRADRARGRAAGGAGLGLAISQWIARAHGGDIALASELGHGTTVTLRLPRAVGGPTADGAVAREVAPAARR
jgi:heavy metal sensor kinase